MRLHFLFFLLFFHLLSSGQEKKIDSTLLITSIKNKTIDIEKRSKFLEKEGYFFHEFHLKEKKDSIISYKIIKGHQTKHIIIDSIQTFVQDILKIKTSKLVILPNQVNPLLNSIKNYYKNRGQSFTKIQLDNLSLKRDTLLSTLNVAEDNKRYINKIVIKGYDRFPKSFIKYYLKNNQPFNDKLLKTTEEKINHLKFVENEKEPATLFTRDSTHLYIYAKKRKVNTLDALIGFTNQENSSKIQFNGHIDIQLINSLHKGESFSFKWNNNGNEQQEISTSITAPYLFKTPVSAGYQLDIFRKDSAFVNTKHQFNINYKPHYQHAIGTYIKTETSSLTTDNQNSNTEAYKKNALGLLYVYESVNEIGITNKLLSIDLSTGNKTTNTKINQQELKTNLIYSYPFFKRNEVYLQNRNAYLKSDQINSNELFRIGGATSIRGFLEQSILTHLYNYTNIEYRYFTNINSYLYGFSDVGYFKNQNNESNLISFGLGYTLGTKGGLLKLSYAVGKSSETEFDLNNGLFHINFVTVF